jgi:hypothetical protein
LRQLKAARKQLRDFNTTARVQLEGQMADLEAAAAQLAGARADLDAVGEFLRFLGAGARLPWTKWTRSQDSGLLGPTRMALAAQLLGSFDGRRAPALRNMGARRVPRRALNPAAPLPDPPPRLRKQQLLALHPDLAETFNAQIDDDDGGGG